MGNINIISKLDPVEIMVRGLLAPLNAFSHTLNSSSCVLHLIVGYLLSFIFSNECCMPVLRPACSSSCVLTSCPWDALLQTTPRRKRSMKWYQILLTSGQTLEGGFYAHETVQDVYDFLQASVVNGGCVGDFMPGARGVAVISLILNPLELLLTQRSITMGGGFCVDEIPISKRGEPR